MSSFYQLLCSLLLVVCALPGAGCGRMPSDADKTGAASPQKVTLLHYFSGTLSGGFNDMVIAFNTKKRPYELNAAPLDHEAFKTSIQDTIDSPRSADLYSYWAGARVRALLPRLEPLDDVWNKGNLSTVFPPPVLAACTYEGRPYILPITQHYVTFFYNKKIFAAAGVTPPHTWPEFLSACEKLKQYGVAPVALGAKEKWPAQFWFDYLLLRTAGFDYRQRLMNGQASYQDPQVKHAFQLWSDVIDKGYFTPRPLQNSWEQATEMVYGGQAAMTLMGTWTIGYWGNETHRWHPGEDYDYFAFPAIDPSIPQYALGPIDGFVLSRKALHPAGAKEVLTYLAAPDVLQAMSKGSGAFIPHTAVDPSFYSPMQQRMLQEVNSTPQWVFNYDLATPPAIAAVGLDSFSEFLAFPEHIDEIMHRAAQQVDRLWSQGQK